MTSRTYGQFCGLARALELVGERWGLLIVRDLIVGPRRFGDLQRGLPRIPTNVLSHRLKELEDAGVVRRRVVPRPASGLMYALTDYGRQLEGVVLELARWGAQSLGPPRPGDIVTPDSLTVALLSTFRPEAARGLHVTYEVRGRDVVVHARIDDGVLQAGAGPLPDADLVIETHMPLVPLLTGEMSPAEAIETGRVHLTGDPELLERFVDLFQIPRRIPQPEVLTA